MSKGFVVDLPAYAVALGAAKGAGFDVDKIAEAIVGVFLGTTKANELPAQLIQEMADVWINFGKDPVGTAIDTAVGATIPMLMFKGLGVMLKTFGLPTRRKIGQLTLKWAL